MADTIVFSGSQLHKLAAPFPPAAISWRVGATNSEKTKGLALAYIDARDVMDRLDAVCGLNGWQCEYVPMPNGTTCCRIGVYINGEWIWKSNGAGATGDVNDEKEREMAEKGGYSDALKRAAVLWGVGRYLYSMPSTWVEIQQRGRSYVIKDSEFAKLARVAANIPGAAPSPLAPGSASETVPQPQESRSRTNPNSSAQLKKNGAWDSFTDRLRGFVEANDVDGMVAWYTSDEVQARVSAWPESWREQAEETFERAHDEAKRDA